jgi:hypothetical protein
MTNPINHNLTIIPNASASTQQNPPLLQIPAELITKILMHLNVTGIWQCRLVSKQFNRLMGDNSFLNQLIKSHFPHFDSKKTTLETKSALINNEVIYLSMLKKGTCSLTSQDMDRPQCYPLTIVDGKLVISLPILAGSREIVFLDLKTNTPTAKFQQPPGYILSCAVSDDLLITGTHHGVIHILDLHSGNYVKQLDAHLRSPIYSLKIIDDKLVSGTVHATSVNGPEIKIWDLNTGNCIKTLEAQSTFTIFDRKLISASHEKKGIKIWDLDTCECINKEGEYENIGRVTAIVIFDEKLIVGSDDGTIKILNFRSGALLANLQGHTGQINFFDIVDDEVLISTCCNRKVKIWDLNTLTCTASLTTRNFEDALPVFYNGKLICGNGPGIDIWDFKADGRAILKEIARELERNTLKGLERFSRLPTAIKNKIYGQLYQMIKPRLANDYWGCAEHAFHDTHGQSSTPSEKAQAIGDYLSAEKELEVSSQLQCLNPLGISTKEQCSEKLSCSPGHLQKIGIISAEDLQVICPLSTDVQTLTIEEDPGIQENFRDHEVKQKAYQRQKALSDLSSKLAQVVTSKIQETDTCGVLLYEGECPWVSLQNKLTIFREKFDAIVLHCNGLPKLSVEAFQIAKYNQLANELNILVGEFQTLDRDHQIAKLCAYVNQWGILKTWTRRQNEGVQHSLKDLPESERTLQKLFHMGE